MARALVLILGLAAGIQARGDAIAVDLSGYDPECGISVRHEESLLNVRWPLGEGEHGKLLIDLEAGHPLIASLGGDPRDGVGTLPVLRGVDPVTLLTVGTRGAPPGRPPTMSVFNTFFDTPANRPHQTERVRLDLKRARVTSHGPRVAIVLGDLSCGAFRGELHLTVYAGARLLHVETVVRTGEPDRAILYDTGLAGPSPGWRHFAWMDTEGQWHREAATPDTKDRPLKVRHRALVAEAEGGSVACFPPPHQFFFPRDLTDNQSVVWLGRGHRGLEDRPAFGVRQTETGGGSFVPWINAPPGTDQRLGVFYLLSGGDAQEALREVLRFTHGDRFPELPGHVTFTSHWHMAIAMAAIEEQARGQDRTTPDFVRMFKDMGVKIVHLAEFHGDGHPQDPGPLRIPELQAMFAECQRLSDPSLLFLPGEEANVYLGIAKPGQHPGHWLYLFPKPVYWTMRRAAGEPFAEEKAPYGTVYHVGDRGDLLRLLEREHGLAWTAHPRIKASSWAPDAYRQEDFYRSDHWLGAAWKAMPADCSQPRLGSRVLDLFDDMANWGDRKYVLGEVDVFKLDHTHELYGHMNVNYLKLDRLPRFDEGWQSVLDTLRGGRFFVTTGEVLIRDFQVGGKSSGETLSLNANEAPELRLDLEWTFPPRFVEVISGDGTKVYRERHELLDGAFGRRELRLRPELRGRRWVRVEAWDIAANGAFTEPVWIEGTGP
jgi:hypothetical protein